jgi:hypothetical protein
MLDRSYTLVPFGEHEFMVRELGMFLRFYPRGGELVARDADWAYYLRRSE